MTSGPVFRDLTTAECDTLLRRGEHGRLAFAGPERIDVLPIHYVYDDGWIYGRTAPGTKLTSVGRSPWVAFEVDEYEGLFDWQSVVVKGTIYLIDDGATERVEEQREHALRLLRRLIPQTLLPGDPTPDRTTIFRLHVDEMTGRAASTGE
ncbi:MAG: pyridoxamine 5'-phosphate oxidase family protein [Gemmatimonadaceae bacterium]